MYESNLQTDLPNPGKEYLRLRKGQFGQCKRESVASSAVIFPHAVAFLSRCCTSWICTARGRLAEASPLSGLDWGQLAGITSGFLANPSGTSAFINGSFLELQSSSA